VRNYEHQHGAELCIPELAEDNILIACSNMADVEGKVVRRFHGHWLAPGDMYIVPKGEPSEWRWMGPCTILQISLNPAFMASIVATALDIEPSRVELVPRITISDPLVYQIGMALLEELRSGSSFGRLYVETLAQSLVLRLLRAHAVFSASAQPRKGAMSSATMRRVLDYIGDNLAHDLTLDEIAGVAGISPYHFTRLFKQSIGLPLHRYVTQRRLESAKRLLLVGAHTIAEVAALTGFADQSHLHRHFKSAYGITPGTLLEQRKNLQRERKDIQDERERTE
jgi:AraC family transcriptional regulator